MAQPAPPDRRWLLLSVLTPRRGEELLLIDGLRRLGARSVEREGERFVARFHPPADLESLLRQARRVAVASTSLEDADLQWRWEDYDAWAKRWAREMGPRRVTDRILVVPAGADAEERPGDLVIRLDPGTAFGTAEHPTTRLCLRFLERLIEEGNTVADIGTGSGILAIAAAHLGAAAVAAVEADPHACEDARRNVQRAGVASRVQVRELLLTADRAPHLGRFDGVVANLEWALLQPLLPTLTHLLTDSGWLVVAGLLAAERQTFLKAATRAGLLVRGDAEDSGWWAAHLSRAEPSAAT
jgi:ribosomal protein L11 methyltransferase